MDGLLVIDKPRGPTSHDVVARMRRVLGERRIGHTGTLDPLATGVLPLVLGRATRLARFLSASDKTYEAVVRLGVRTDTADGEGTPIGAPFRGTLPGRDEVESALSRFRGTFVQRPPAFSARKIGGARSYAIARARARMKAESAPLLARPATVTVPALEIAAFDRDVITLHLTCSAGFYVRALADDLGEQLGTGAHLVELRRTRSGDYTLDAAVSFGDADRDSSRAAAAVVPLDRMLPSWPAIELTDQGVRYAAHGRGLAPDAATGRLPWRADAPIRLVDMSGRLVGLGEATTGGLLHPFVIFV